MPQVYFCNNTHRRQFYCCDVDSVAAKLPFVFCSYEIEIVSLKVHDCSHRSTVASAKFTSQRQHFAASSVFFAGTQFCSSNPGIVTATADWE